MQSTFNAIGNSCFIAVPGPATPPKAPVLDDHSSTLPSPPGLFGINSPMASKGLPLDDNSRSTDSDASCDSKKKETEATIQVAGRQPFLGCLFCC